MQQPTEAHRASGASTAQKIVFGLIAAAILVSGIPFAGWVFDAPSLKSFGVSGYPMWPLSAAGYLFLAAGFLASIARHRAAPWLLAIPLLIALCVLVENVADISPGIDRLLFGDQVGRFVAEHPGRPVANSVATYGFLGLALLVADRRHQASAELANLLASAAFCFGLASALLLLFIAPGHEAALRIFVAPLPGSLITVALATAFLLWRSEAGWALLLTNRTRGPAFWLMLPLIIALPILPTLIARWGMRAGPVAAPETELLAVLANVAIIGFLLWLSVDRFRRQQTALQDVTLALDVAAITLTRPDGEITYWSRGCEQLYGWSAVEAIGRKKYELLHSRYGEGGPGEPPYPTGSAERELVERRRDGTEISVLEATQVHERPDREPLFVLKMLDISERVRTESALRLSEARLAAAADTHKISISHWEVASGRLELSPGSEQRLGFPPGSLSTFEQWRAAVDPEDIDHVMAVLARAAAEKQEHIAYSYRFHQPNGLVRTIEGSSRCSYDETGTLTTVVGTHVDVTERNERETALQLRSIVDTIPDATIVIDSAGSIRSFSAAAERMFGVDSAAAIGRNVTFLMPDGIAAGHDESIARYLVTGERHVIGTMRELTARRADGSPFPIELNLGEALLGEERIFTAVIRDVSDRLAAEQRMSDLNSDLAHISRQNAMSELAADLAHELNQPLSATANFLATARMLIEKGESGGRVADLLRMGEEQTLRSGEIIRRLRAFLTKRDGEMQVESLELVVREAVDLVLFGTTKLDIRLTYRLDPSADTIFADRIQVQQVLVNLLRNAVDALRSRDGTRQIVIASRATDDDFVEISVSDNGPGLPDALRDQLYSRFATTKAGGAMGIGLSISRRIVEAHGGTLVAANRPEGGAVFRFTVPAIGELDE
ncbi:MAG: Two-component oxygen-sensor histidine kinase FixL [Sphingomonas bacterium]|uniref:PAS domain-containing sensor histidine kinase n=1 Tax=Sphingomonas bacterium TaxID=1895847 RepID=UPI002604D7FD|nr:PAS domain S-box protein [Sphingomonas bacterium]MDB5702886.1 Two-component oxygen-sensor histidine kinase FixL [Sphingomonas bacterium]